MPLNIKDSELVHGMAEPPVPREGATEIARIWLAIHYPPNQDGNPKLPADAQDSKFLGAINILELSTVLITTPGISQWTWHSNAHMQWHALAVVLAGTCSRPSSRKFDRAWECANAVYNRWNLRADKDNPWRPIKRLMAKAHYLRERQTRSSERQPHLMSSEVVEDPVTGLMMKDAWNLFNDESWGDENNDDHFSIGPSDDSIFFNQYFLGEGQRDFESLNSECTMSD